MKCGWGGGSNSGDDGRRGRRRGTGFWKGKTNQSIDGSSTCTCAPPRSVPCPARLESRSFPLYGFSRRRYRVGKECGSAHSPAPPRLSHSSRVCHLAVARCSAHHTITSLIGISILERTLITIISTPYVLHQSFISFLTATCIKSNQNTSWNVLDRQMCVRAFHAFVSKNS